MTVIGVFVAASVGRLAARFGQKWFVTIGPLIAAAGYASTSVTAAVLSAVTGQQAGIASAANNAVTRVAGLVTIAVVGLVTGPTPDYTSFSPRRPDRGRADGCWCRWTRTNRHVLART